MCCQPEHGVHYHHCHHGVSRTECCCQEPSFRRFVSKKEHIERLEKYKKELQKELEAVNEHLDDLSG